VAINNLCQYCTYPCSTCINSTSKCLSCALNSSLFYDSSNFACVNSISCPNSTYSDNSSYACSTCNLSCLICTGSSINCSKCSPSYYLLSSDNSCSISCPNGTVQANSTEGGICQACTHPCLTCSGAVSFCLSCSQDNSTLFLNNNGTCVGNSSCQIGAYANSTNFMCSSCASPCTTCLSTTFCLSCQANFSLIGSNNTCSNSCPSSYAPADANGSSVCTSCNYPCSTCSSSINNCTSCTSNSSLYLQGSQCVNATSCQTGTYANQTSNVC
jgi:proprotein convertase subtilisin/kexin type 5